MEHHHHASTLIGPGLEVWGLGLVLVVTVAVIASRWPRATLLVLLATTLTAHEHAHDQHGSMKPPPPVCCTHAQSIESESPEFHVEASVLEVLWSPPPTASVAPRVFRSDPIRAPPSSF